jgi:putative phosphoesterase
MRMAAIYDIHGNQPALEAVLDELERTGVDQIIVGGDVLPGPMPREVLDMLLGLATPTRFIRGNGETDVLSVLDGVPPHHLPDRAREVVQWSAEVLSPEHVDQVRAWPNTTRLMTPQGDALFCHATPGSDRELFTVLTPDDRLLPVLEATAASLVVCGHTHMQFDRTVGDIRVVNAGSVGMPFGEPGAYWLLLDADVQLRRTEYDLEAAAVRIRFSDYPQASEFATANVLAPPAASDMLELFEKAALS